MGKIFDFTVSKFEHDLIVKITQRAIENAARVGYNLEYMTLEMDITLVHKHQGGLKLDELLAADDGNFNHDVFGIRRHINRHTGELEDFFVPRFSLNQ